LNEALFLILVKIQKKKIKKFERGFARFFMKTMLEMMKNWKEEDEEWKKKIRW